MFGRRSHSRFTINPASDGVLRILNDVVVQPSDTNQMIAISREPGVVGEVVADGAVRHQLRLDRVHQPDPEL